MTFLFCLQVDGHKPHFPHPAPVRLLDHASSEAQIDFVQMLLGSVYGLGQVAVSFSTRPDVPKAFIIHCTQNTVRASSPGLRCALRSLLSERHCRRSHLLPHISCQPLVWIHLRLSGRYKSHYKVLVANVSTREYCHT